MELNAWILRQMLEGELAWWCEMGSTGEQRMMTTAEIQEITDRLRHEAIHGDVWIRCWWEEEPMEPMTETEIRMLERAVELTAAERAEIMRCMPDSRGAHVLAYIEQLETEMGSAGEQRMMTTAERDVLMHETIAGMARRLEELIEVRARIEGRPETMIRVTLSRDDDPLRDPLHCCLPRGKVIRLIEEEEHVLGQRLSRTLRARYSDSDAT